MHFIVVFIVLGIGADDIFVFTDAWKQSDQIISIRQAAKDDEDL
jgi:hypothetical protein